jgi:integrating conjugative element protein (TIGR03749 family)
MIRWLFFAILMATGVVQADEHIVWDKSPIDISLGVGSERQLVFPEPVQIGITQSAKARFATLSSVGNRVFIEPLVEFEKQRILVKGTETGITFVLYLSTTSQDDLEPVVNIHVERVPNKEQSRTSNPKRDATSQKINSYRFLGQYIAQQLYAPERLVKNVNGIQRVSVPGKTFRSFFRCTARSRACSSVIAKPIVSFKTNRLYASAIEVRNTSAYPVDNDPRLVKALRSGTLLASIPIHGRLLPATYGNKARSVMIVIHKRPLHEMFGGLQ